MKFFKNFTIICFAASSISFAEEAGKADDFFAELAGRNITASPTEENVENELLLSNTNTASFFIVGENSFGFAYIKSVIFTAEDIILEYLGAKISPHNKINLRIISDTDKDYKEPFYIESYADKSMYLMLRWDENLKYEAFCKFIMGSMLRKLVLEQKLSLKIPYFLESALSTLLQERVKKAYSSSELKKANEVELLNLKDSLTIERNSGNAELNELSAYVNLLALKRFYKSQKSLNSNLSAFLLRGDEYDIYAQISKEYKDGDLETYFKCIVQSEISARTGGVRDMAESAEELLRLSFIRKDSRNLAFGDKDIFKNRKDKEVLAAINKRIVEIKVFLGQINPAYFNALISLGEMFEAVLNDEEEDFDTARLSFIEYFRAAKYIESKANSLFEL